MYTEDLLTMSMCTIWGHDVIIINFIDDARQAACLGQGC